MTGDRARGVGSRAAVDPAARSWRVRIDDPDEPLYTVAVAADLLGIGTQTLRRLEQAISQHSSRPSGNQRRYSRNDVGVLAHAAAIAEQGHPPSAIATILELERRIDSLSVTDDD